MIYFAAKLLFGIDLADIFTRGGFRFQAIRPAPNTTFLAATPMSPIRVTPAVVGSREVNTDAGKDFVARVLGSTERVWDEIFRKMGRQYQKPNLVLFSGYVQSACGMAQSAMGPFYCPLDQKVYIDLSFYQDMKSRLGAPGDFAQAYVIAHEIGHHVQNLFGIAEKVTQARMRSSEAVANSLSVRMELQADCFAGIWAKEADATRKILEDGDIEEGLNAAAAIGDDRLQKRSTVMSCPTPLPMAARRSAFAGSSKGFRHPTCVIATHLEQTSSDGWCSPREDSMDISAIGRQFGLDDEQTRAALDALVPVVAAGMRRTAQSPEGLQEVLRQVLTGGYGGSLDDDRPCRQLRARQAGRR